MRRTIVQTLILLGLAILPAIATGVAHPHRPMWSGADQLALRTARGWGRQVLFVDVRPPEQYLLDRIPGALPLQLSTWEQFLPAVRDASKDKRIVIYGQSGSESDAPRIAEKLRHDLARDEIYILRGGFDAWNAAMR